MQSGSFDVGNLRMESESISVLVISSLYCNVFVVVVQVCLINESRSVMYESTQVKCE